MTPLVRRILFAAALVAFACSTTPAVAQRDALEIDEIDDSDYPTVEMTVAVPAQLGQVQLPPDAFEVFEDGESRGRPSLGVAEALGEPAAPRVVLAIDVSGSMGGEPIDQARAAATDFVGNLRRGSEVAVVTFGNVARIEQNFTSDTADVLDSIQSIEVDQPARTTALYSGVLRARSLLARSKEQAPRSIVILSDGADQAGTVSLDDAVAQLTDFDAQVWAVGLENNDTDLDALASLTGSSDRVLTAATEELQSIYTTLASDLSRQFLLRYESQADGETTIDVQLTYGAIDASAARVTTIEQRRTPTPQEELPTSMTTRTVTVPLVGTTAALSTGIGALSIGALLVIIAIATAPQSAATRRRLMQAPGSQLRPGLTVMTEWLTDRADRQLRGGRVGQAIDRRLEQAGLDVRIGEVVVVVASLMLVAYALGLTVANSLFGLALALAVPLGARLVLTIRRDRRQTAFAEQFVDVLQLLAGSLRAGHGMVQGIDAVARDAQEPAASEFRRILLEHRLGRDLTEAMHETATRLENEDFEWVVQAIAIHREVGGDLARILDNVIATVRERAAVHRQVKALSAEGRMSARVLTGLPVVVLVAISFIDPGYLGAMTSRPIGLVMLGFAGSMLLVGTLVIRRMVKIRY